MRWGKGGSSAGAWLFAAAAVCCVSPASNAGSPAEPADAGTVSVQQPSSPAAADAGSPAYARIRAALESTWTEATDIWASLVGRDLYDSDTPMIDFVPVVKAAHCYGLYIGAGPVYCSGNNTIFVSLAEMQRLETKIPGFSDDGLGLLVAHELGHHIQKITGRFRLLSILMRQSPGSERDLVRRFELEADCLAGMWAARSHLEAGHREALLAAAEVIGDDRVYVAGETASDPAMFTHGSAVQRRHWFEAGLNASAIEQCHVLDAEAY